jgi:cytidylate kinase
MDTKSGKTTLRKMLAAACEPPRAEWYFNNIRYRSRLSPADEKFFGNGTCRNEQVHATLNRQYRETIQITRRMLDAQLDAWLGAEMAVFLRAMETSTTVKINRVNLRSIVISGVCCSPSRHGHHI